VQLGGGGVKTNYRNRVIGGDDSLVSTNADFNELWIRRAREFLNSQKPWWRDKKGGAWWFWATSGDECSYATVVYRS
jgi:hypothetical protein